MSGTLDDELAREQEHLDVAVARLEELREQAVQHERRSLGADQGENPQSLYERDVTALAASARRSQALAITSGPMPAGSPIETASGITSASAILDHRVTAQVAELLLGAQVDAGLLQLVLHLVGAGQGRGLAIVTSA